MEGERKKKEEKGREEYTQTLYKLQRGLESIVSAEERGISFFLFFQFLFFFTSNSNCFPRRSCGEEGRRQQVIGSLAVAVLVVVVTGTLKKVLVM